MMFFRPALFAALAAIAFPATLAHAQDQLPPVAMPVVPPHNCVKPEMVNSLSTQNQIKAFNKNYKAYADCITKYTADAKALANAAIVSGNAAVDEFNKVSAEIKSQNEAASK